MTKEVEQVRTDRRGFMKLAGMGAVAGGATIVAGEATAEAARPEKAAGYRETEHVKTFYATARF